MALSVSGFPGPSRHANDVFSNADDGNNKNIVNNPRLRGFFGGNNAMGTRKPEPNSSATSPKPDSELEEPVLSGHSPPTSPILPFSAPPFEPLSQEEYEEKLNLQNIPSRTTAPRPSHHEPPKRHQLPRLPRRTSPSPVRLGVGPSRLDYGIGSRSPPPHARSPPASTTDDRGAKHSEGSPSATTPSSAQSSSGGNRPLPSVPDKTSPGSTMAYAGLSGSPGTSSLIYGPLSVC